ncbi:MAG TPA: electron transport complex subunit RsxC [Thermoanaerobacterales bacterium]|uniref:electron transport complex subunit RsxC n=1 Tax=Tepidanaerobacter sp. GT38 TaxID=2722793 RepID=UPI00183B3619|nr:electron transport complex subunit RsxC [Tepidanaerobacter sp. GT38]MCG1011890.1 electron transport complex subunit RsxC [Tepidanaerobacter sp. GT38]HHY42529.1 electron transport complex subunit RsxC [Thermoanaerobacterales bacterium]
MLKTFKGGIHPPYNKDLTNSKPIEKATLPKKVIIPMGMHIGAPSEPIVKVGDMVKKGQKIGEAKSFVSVPVHASISGKVTAVEPRPWPGGGLMMSVVIESDGKDELDYSITPPKPLSQLSPDEIKNLIREAGITGLGGAGFPTQVKLSFPPEKNVDTIIINAAECEPYITADHRLLLERPDDVVLGIEAIMKATGIKRAFIGIEDNKLDAVESIKKTIKDKEGIEVVVLATKYPQGGEKQLIKAVTGREVPSGGLPMDAGVIVNNAGTCAAIANTLKTGLPLIERITTVTGSGIKEPKNLLIRIGTPLIDIIEQCGGFKGTPGKVLMGGPMMGLAQSTLDVPAIKGTSGLLVLEKHDLHLFEPSPCIKCARCVDACPINLLPTTIAKFAQKNMWNEAELYHAMDCVECGCCSYVCPAHIPLTQHIRIAKSHIIALRRQK